MIYVRLLPLLWIIPCSWIDAILVRKKPFEVRYNHVQRWCERLFKTMKIQLQVTGYTDLPTDQPLLFISNHQSSFDLIMLAFGIPVPFTFVSKVQNKRIPYLSSWSKTLDLIYFNRDDQGSAIHMLRESARRLKEGKNLLIFPEGTRSRSATMHDMMAGSLQPAFLSKALIVPIVLINSYDFKHLLKHKGVAKMTILDPIPFSEYKPLKVDGVSELVQTRMRAELEKLG